MIENNPDDRGQDPRQESFTLGDWRVEPALNRISDRSGRISDGSSTRQLEPRFTQILLCLSRRPGEVVSRRELLDEVWSGVVVKEEALTYAISRLRQLLEDDPNSPRYIETIRKGGYRLIASIEDSSNGGQSAERRPGSAILKIGVPIVIAVIIGAASLLGRQNSDQRPSGDLEAAIPLTSYPGLEVLPAISADGNWVAFLADSADGGTLDLYAKRTSEETAFRLTRSREIELFPVWFAEADSLAYVVNGDSRATIYTLPRTGGQALPLLELSGLVSGLDWSPGGEWIVFSLKEGMGQPRRLQLYSVLTGERRTISPAPVGTVGDSSPRFSPDGKSLLYIRSDEMGFQDIYLLELAGGVPRRLTTRLERILGLDWLPGSDGLIFSAGWALVGDCQLFELRLNDGGPRPLATPSHRPLEPAVASSSGDLVYREESYSCDIFHYRLGEERGEIPPHIASTQPDYSARLSWDGSSIAFLSNRSGTQELWLVNADGGEPRRLTDFDGAMLGLPAWSRNDKQIGLHVVKDGLIRVHIVDVETGSSSSLTPEDHSVYFLGWTHDDTAVYGLTGRHGGAELHRYAIDGGERELVLSEDLYHLEESSDGKYLYITYLARPGIWRRNLATGKEESLFDFGSFLKSFWRLVGEELYFFRSESRRMMLCRGNPATGEWSDIEVIPRLTGFFIDIAPDGGSILMDRRLDEESDLLLRRQAR